MYFQKLLYNNYKVEGDSEFKILTEAIKSTPNTFQLHSLAEVKILLDSLAKGTKALLLLDDKMLKEYKEYL